MSERIESTPTTDSTQAAARSAVLLLSPGRSELNVAALTVFDRALVGLHRAGCTSLTVVGSGPVPRAPRAEALGIRFEVVQAPPVVVGPTLVMRAEVLVQVRDLERVRWSGGRLVGATGELLPVGVVIGGPGDWEREWAACPAVKAEGVACWVRDGAEAAEAGRRLWASLTSASDGWVDRVFNRPVGRPLARALSHTRVTPNQISVASIVLGVVSGGLFGLGQQGWAIAAGLLFQLSAVLDCVDGDVARVVFKESPLGKWLDLIGDQLVHVSVFVGIAVGLSVAGSRAPVGWLGAMATAGALMSFAMVLRSMRQAGRTADSGPLGRLLNAATNRDFSVLVLALACAGRLEMFLWAAAVGSHVFWMLLWVAQRRSTTASRGDA